MENTIMCYLEYLMYFIIHMSLHVRLPCLWQSFILKKSNFRIVLPHIYIFYLKPNIATHSTSITSVSIQFDIIASVSAPQGGCGYM